MFNNLTWTLQNLSSTWIYFNQLIDSVSPTVNFLYDNVLTNPIFIWLVLVILVLSFFNFE